MLAAVSRADLMSELFTQQQHNLVTQMAQKRDRSNPLREGLRTGLAGTRKEESVSQSGRESLILTPVKDRSRGEQTGITHSVPPPPDQCLPFHSLPVYTLTAWGSTSWHSSPSHTILHNPT